MESPGKEQDDDALMGKLAKGRGGGGRLKQV